jgi:hypothetical protein
MKMCAAGLSRIMIPVTAATYANCSGEMKRTLSGSYWSGRPALR